MWKKYKLVNHESQALSFRGGWSFTVKVSIRTWNTAMITYHSCFELHFTHWIDHTEVSLKSVPLGPGIHSSNSANWSWIMIITGGCIVPIMIYRYPLVNIQTTMEHVQFIVNCPMKNGGSVHRFLYAFQRLSTVSPPVFAGGSYCFFGGFHPSWHIVGC